MSVLRRIFEALMNTTKDSRHDPLVEAVSLLTCEICALREQRVEEFNWFKAHVQLATKEDLKDAERRIIAAIKKDDQGGLTKDDERALELLLQRGETLVRKLEALDAQTPPMP